MKPRQLGASGYVLEHAMKEVFTLTHNGINKSNDNRPVPVVKLISKAVRLRQSF